MKRPLVLAAATILLGAPLSLRARSREMLRLIKQQKVEQQALKLKEKYQNELFRRGSLSKAMRIQMKHELQREKRELRERQKDERQKMKDQERMMKESSKELQP